MIKIAEKSELSLCAEIIGRSFAEFVGTNGITLETAPNYVAFTTEEKLLARYDVEKMCLYLCEKEPAAFFSIAQLKEDIFEIKNLSVLPKFRHKGIGEEILEYCEKTAFALGGGKLVLSILDANDRLKRWYFAHGYEQTGTARFDELPFEVGFLEKEL